MSWELNLSTNDDRLSKQAVSNISLILLIGLPGSGKSTLAKQLIQENFALRIISTDAIRSQLFGHEAIQGSWLKVWQEVGRQFRQAVEQIKAGERSAAIYDATNAVRRQRRQAIALARESGFTQVVGLWINTPLPICLERNQQRYRQVPVDIILRMHRALVGAPPGPEEGLDQAIEISSSGVPVREFYPRLAIKAGD